MIIQRQKRNFMARFGALIAVVLVLLGLLFIWQKPTKDKAVAKSVMKEEFADWHLYSSPNDSFKVFFPTLPQNASTTVTDKETQKPLTYNTFVAEKPDGTTFIVNVITLSDNPPDDIKVLKKLVDQMVLANKDNHLSDVKEGNWHQYKSLDFLIDNNDVKVLAKAFKKGNRIYVISTIRKGEDIDPTEHLFFINSFEVNDK